ncbi:MAG TPA: efflux transporter outer membrane subunit [Thermoanaerobaculales bacterium]|nr:efflux transporter outer membrane subunit [Thermoanaerobaculales bacterium]HPA79457.1 efflux transporter outer membrane subunit [Thermoanaerobaculales bacterium]HQL29469.1 efflux transporter outer membrane subunit [Thermoanaerobaculales bacterium]
MARRVLIAAVLCSLAAACTLGPDYQRPPIATPEGWRQAAAAEASIANLPWWELFQDEQLQSLIRTALAENRDLKIAIERIEEARATYGYSRADLYPKIDASATAGSLQFSGGSLTHTPEGGVDTSMERYGLDVGLSWELDFFGRIRRANEAELANLLATEEARRAVAIAVVANVARAYVELRDLDWRLEITRRTLESRREYLGLARDRFEGGLTPELDSRQAEAEMYRVQSYVFQLEGLVAQKENEISYLLGRNPSAVPRGRAVGAQPIPPEVPAGLPAALLERRPDVRQAEEQLISANARIGEARAMLYPQIALTGTYGFASTDLSELLDGSSESWNIFAGLLQPIFQGGKNRRRVEVRESQQRQAVYAYERTVLQALREVEDALIGLQKAGEQRGSQAERVVAERKVLELSELRYRGGVTDYLEVLDAQRSLFNAEIDEVSSISAHVGSLIQLYKALGGGWPVGATAAEQDQNSMSEKGSSG